MTADPGSPSAAKERAAGYGFREQTMVAKFRSTDEDAREIKRICEVAVAAFLTPSEQAASALFELGAAAVVVAAQEARDGRR